MKRGMGLRSTPGNVILSHNSCIGLGLLFGLLVGAVVSMSVVLSSYKAQISNYVEIVV